MRGSSKHLMAAATLVAGLVSSTQASALECSSEFQIQQTFANGAAWEMCFEEQQREGMVLRDIHYTTTCLLYTSDAADE